MSYTSTTVGRLVAETAPRSTPPPTKYTLGQLVTALNSLGLNVEKPTAVAGMPNTSSAVATVGGVCNAMEDHTWSVLHSGPSDLVVAGPVSRLPVPELVEAVVRAKNAHNPESTDEGDGQAERRGRYAGGFSCTQCGHFNMLHSAGGAPSSERWYAVVAGLQVGVFQGNAIANSYTLNVSGSSQKAFATRAEAEAAFERARAAGIVRKITPADTQVLP